MKKVLGLDSEVPFGIYQGITFRYLTTNYNMMNYLVWFVLNVKRYNYTEELKNTALNNKSAKA